MRKKAIVINGKFLSQKITGVQRYAREILHELDKLLTPDDNVILLADKKAYDIPSFRNINVQIKGGFTGNIWEQTTLPLYAIMHNAICVNLCNMAPILKPDIVVIHDVSYKVNKRFFSKKFALWYNFVFSLIIHRIKTIFTVSEFSKSEIVRCYGISPEKITVTYNGWQHFERIPAATDALQKYGLTPGDYYFAMSSMAPNKNFKWLAYAAKVNPDVIFAVSGAVNRKVFGDIFDFEIPDNLKFLGYVSDEESKELVSKCRAFIFPSFYEGFGLPPLEALSTGAKVVVSDRSCMHEIFGSCVYYISPDDPDVDIEKLISQSCDPTESLLCKYSWAKSAEIINSYLQKN